MLFCLLIVLNRRDLKILNAENGQNAENAKLLFWIVDDSEEEIRVCSTIGDGKHERLVDRDFCEG